MKKRHRIIVTFHLGHSVLEPSELLMISLLLGMLSPAPLSSDIWFLSSVNYRVVLIDWKVGEETSHSS